MLLCVATLEHARPSITTLVPKMQVGCFVFCSNECVHTVVVSTQLSRTLDPLHADGAQRR